MLWIIFLLTFTMSLVRKRRSNSHYTEEQEIGLFWSLDSWEMYCRYIDNIVRSVTQKQLGVFRFLILEVITWPLLMYRILVSLTVLLQFVFLYEDVSFSANFRPNWQHGVLCYSNYRDDFQFLNAISHVFTIPTKSSIFESLNPTHSSQFVILREELSQAWKHWDQDLSNISKNQSCCIRYCT